MVVKEALRQRLATEPLVRFALLFGSRARGDSREESDWDIAVYLDESVSSNERFRMRLRLTARLEEVAPVDVVVLNDADPLLGQRALQGESLDVKDRGRYVHYFVRTMALAEDQRYFDGILGHARMRRLEEGEFGRP